MIQFDRNIRVALIGFMKPPPRQFTDAEARQRVEAFIRGDEPATAPRRPAPAIAVV